MSVPFNFESPPQGWQCPVCKHVMSPGMSFCLFCPLKTKVTTSDNH